MLFLIRVDPTKKFQSAKTQANYFHFYWQIAEQVLNWSDILRLPLMISLELGP